MVESDVHAPQISPPAPACASPARASRYGAAFSTQLMKDAAFSPGSEMPSTIHSNDKPARGEQHRRGGHMQPHDVFRARASAVKGSGCGGRSPSPACPVIGGGGGPQADSQRARAPVGGIGHRGRAAGRRPRPVRGRRRPHLAACCRAEHRTAVPSGSTSRENRSSSLARPSVAGGPRPERDQRVSISRSPTTRTRTGSPRCEGGGSSRRSRATRRLKMMDRLGDWSPRADRSRCAAAYRVPDRASEGAERDRAALRARAAV